MDEPVIPPPVLPEGLTPDIFRVLVENQTRELELKAAELSLQKQQDEHGYEFGKAALVAKIEDRKHERQHNLAIRHSAYIFFGVIAFLLAGIIGYSVYANHTEIAMEIIKALVFIGSGAVGGYGVAKTTGNAKDQDQNKTE